MNPEEARNHCSECGDPITTQHEIDFELCDECFNIAKQEADYQKYKDEYARDEEIRDRNCEL
jgi:predicted nucleic acid-binding Zn ribbon protein